MEAIAAERQPLTRKSGKMADTNKSIKPFMNIRKIPSVKMVTGRVIKIKIGRIKVFIMARRTAAISAVVKEST